MLVSRAQPMPVPNSSSQQQQQQQQQPKMKNNSNKPINRSNSFVNVLKWWPLQSSSQQQSTAAAASSPANGGAAAMLHLPSHLHNNKTLTFGSSVAVQKLRESKWFKRDEARIFCAVIECGFIVELRNSAAAAARNNNGNSGSSSNRSSYNEERDGAGGGGGGGGTDSDDEDGAQDENVTPLTTWFGIVLCKASKDHKTKPDTIEIFSVKIRETGTFKMIKLTLDDVWTNGWELRINNFADKEKAPHNEKDIRQQVSFARKAKQSLWNNNKHFVYWCRYGSRQQDVRKRQMSECVRWGSVGMNAGMLLVMNKQKSYAK